MFDDRLFFQISAALIPAILFGGLVSGAFRPSAGWGLRTDRVRILVVVGVAAAIAVAVVAEFFTIGVATSPGRPSFLKIYVVVWAVSGAAVLAGWALFRPWIRTLPSRYRAYATPLVVLAGVLLQLIGVSALTVSIVDAERKAEDERSACVEVQSRQFLRETGLDAFAASDAVDARWEDVLQLQDESIRLRQEGGLSRAQRKALRTSLRDRGRAAADRWKNATDNYGRVTRESLDQLGIKKHQSQKQLMDAFTRALGC